MHGTYLVDVLPGMALFGIGAGLAFTPSIALAMADAAPADTGLASGLAKRRCRWGRPSGSPCWPASRPRDQRTRWPAARPHAALAGGYHVGYLIAAGCIAFATVIAVVIFRDRTIGRVLTTEEQATVAMLEPEIGL